MIYISVMSSDQNNNVLGSLFLVLGITKRLKPIKSDSKELIVTSLNIFRTSTAKPRTARRDSISRIQQ